MNTVKMIPAAALLALLLLPAATGAAAVKRQRPSDVPGAQTAVSPDGIQLYNDYTSPERTYSSERVVVHYVASGIDAPPLNDDDGDQVPDYVERVGAAADRALAYYARRGFHAPLPDTGGPDGRPDLYVSRFAPGTLGVAFPSGEAGGGAFAVVSNNLDPSAGRSFASVYATVAHELFHLVQFSYFGRGEDPPIPAWILEGTASALETAADPELDDLVSTLQTEDWLSAPERSLAEQSYGAQLLWRRLDAEQPRFLPALFRRLAARPVTGDGRREVAATYAWIAGGPFPAAFHRFAVRTAVDHADAIEPVFGLARGSTRRSVVEPLAVDYVRLLLPRGRPYALTVAFPRGRAPAAASVTYELESESPGGPPRAERVVGRVSDAGRRVTFTVPASLGADPRLAHPLLVVSNGSGRRVAYAVAAR